MHISIPSMISGLTGLSMDFVILVTAREIDRYIILNGNDPIVPIVLQPDRDVSSLWVFWLNEHLSG